MSRRVTPVGAHIESGLCNCGCGDVTPLATRTLTALGWFAGLPRPYIPGHGGRIGKKRGPDHHLFVGRRVMNGYVYIYRPDHPHALRGKVTRGYVAEHRIVLETQLGRLLTADEHGHHINGVRDDNRPENLIALSRAEHRRVHGSGYQPSAEHRRKLSEAAKRQHARRRQQVE